MVSEIGFIGRVTRCSTRGFVGAVQLPGPEAPAFGTFCKAEAQQGQSYVVGLIYDISIEDDPFARQLATIDDLPTEHLVDSQSNRQVPIEYSALSVGYHTGDIFHQGLPPQPPLTLAEILTLSTDEIITFTQNLDFIPTILSVSTFPVEDLLVSSLRKAADVRPEGERMTFLTTAGRACARFLADDLNRLEHLLRVLGS